MNKSTVMTALAALLVTSTASFAENYSDFEKVDENGDSMITLEQGRKVHADWTEDAFKALDTDANGSLNDTEYSAASMKRSDSGADSGTVENKPATAKHVDTMSPGGSEAGDRLATFKARKKGLATYLDKTSETDVMASELIGMRIYAVEADIDDSKTYPEESRKDWNDIGEVNDVVLDWNGGVKAVVLGVGGFLGIGEKDVAVEMASIRKVRERDDSGDWFLVVNSSRASLEQAPTYRR